MASPTGAFSSLSYWSGRWCWNYMLACGLQQSCGHYASPFQLRRNPRILNCISIIIVRKWSPEVFYERQNTELALSTSFLVYKGGKALSI